MILILQKMSTYKYLLLIVYSSWMVSEWVLVQVEKLVKTLSNMTT